MAAGIICMVASFTEVLESRTNVHQPNGRFCLVSRKDRREHYLEVLSQQQKRNNAFHGTVRI